MSEDEYRKLVGQRRAWYKALGAIYCPCLRADVRFNAKGFYHLLYDGNGMPRPRDEQIRRLMLLPLVPEIIANVRSVGGNQMIKGIEYLVLQKQIITSTNQNVLARVIIRKKASGNYYYHSIMDERQK